MSNVYRPVLPRLLPEPEIKKSIVSLNETLEFPFWGLNICVDFDLRDSKKMENLNQVKKIIFYYKNIDIHKTA